MNTFHKNLKKFIDYSNEIINISEPDFSREREMRASFPTEYQGLQLKVSFGMSGNWAYITWMGFLTEGMTISNGIYPVYLYFREQKLLILAYGVSETNTPAKSWPDFDKTSIKEYFKKNRLGKARRYNGSFVYKAYTEDELNNITEEFDNDLNTLIGMYKEMMNESLELSDGTSKTVAAQSTLKPPLQKIYFGSPGTGKSHQCKEDLKGYGIDEEKNKGVDRLFRTTFHPDSDYASFVGCYKPICESRPKQILDLQGLQNAAAQLNGNTVPTMTKFFSEHAESLLNEEKNATSWTQLLTSIFGYVPSSDSYLHYLSKIVAELRKKQTFKITYSFVPQVFTDAYVKAWNEYEKTDTEKKQMVFLVIEEINRGNCAQIFGDLFQLLDRKEDGLSEYRIKADKDLAEYLKGALKPGSEGIKDGELCLPPNLSILATMNTSDQSLFPMDSAFKRRWDWEYVPIDYSDKVRSGSFKITIGTEEGKKEYSWVEFLKKINPKILDLTDSEDKLLGNFFIKKDIAAKELKSKVMFYMWSEICKDYVHSNSFFKYKDKSDKETEFTFMDLYTDKETEILHGFMQHLEVNEIETDNTVSITADGEPEEKALTNENTADLTSN